MLKKWAAPHLTPLNPVPEAADASEVAGPPRPVYSAPNKPEGFDDPWQPKEKKQKRVSIYANQNGGIANPKKGKRKRMGAPHGPQF